MNLLSFMYSFLTMHTYLNYYSCRTPLYKDGFCTVVLPDKWISIQSFLRPLLPKGYVFLDYKYVINGPALFTYHRDVTSSQTTLNTSYPTYTAIHYEYEGEFLSVSPGSHIMWKFNIPTTIKGPQNTVVIFNCDLVHGGLDAPPNVTRKATQYKIAHLSDLHKLTEVQGISVVQKGSEVNPALRTCMRIFSYVFVVPIQTVFLPLLQRRSFTGFSSFLQDLVPIQYFNNLKPALLVQPS
jgi:hypothetical protein